MMLPQKYENQVYQSGISSEYLDLSNRASELLFPNVITSSELEYKNIGVLKKYKIGDFELELPIGDPLIKIRPTISLVGKKVDLWHFRFTTTQREESYLFHTMVRKIFFTQA